MNDTKTIFVLTTKNSISNFKSKPSKEVDCRTSYKGDRFLKNIFSNFNFNIK